MKIGTPGFVGSKLREAREARGLSGVTLAELLGVSRQAVSQFESGAKSPTQDTLRRMTEVLNIPQTFFLQPPEEVNVVNVFFRSRAASTRAARKKATWRLVWLKRTASFVSDYIELPLIDFPKFNFSSNPAMITDDDIEQAATATRRFWGLKDGPISNVTLLLENSGAIILREPFDEHNLDAHSAWIDAVPYITLSEDKHSAVRSRLDVAHELGHLLVHRNLDEGRLEKHIDDHKLTERQAYWFASCFLMPRSSFARDFAVPTLDYMLTLKSKWKVSVAAILMYSKLLGLITPEKADHLFALHGRRGWKRREPLDDDIPAEQPRLLRLAFELAIGEKVFAPEDVLAGLSLYDSDVENLAGLPPGTIGDKDPTIRILTLPVGRTNNKSRRGVANPGEVVRFHQRDRTV